MSVLSLIVVLLGAICVAAAQWNGAPPQATLLFVAAVGCAATAIERRATRSFYRSKDAPIPAAPKPPVRNPGPLLDKPTMADYMTMEKFLSQSTETIAKQTDTIRVLEHKLANADNAIVDVSNLSEGFAYRIYRRKPRNPDSHPSFPNYDEHGLTTDPLLAARLTEQGWTAEMIPVWVLADGRVARKRSGGAANYFTIIKEIQA